MAAPDRRYAGPKGVMNRKLRSVGLSGAAVVLVAGVQATLGLWPVVLADSPNCAEYPAACAQYQQNSSIPWILLAGVVILAAALIVAAVLILVVVRPRRRRGAFAPPPGPSPTSSDQPR